MWAEEQLHPWHGAGQSWGCPSCPGLEDALCSPAPGWHSGRELKGKITGVIPAAATSFARIQFQMELLHVPKPGLV